MANWLVIVNGLPFTGWLDITAEQSFDKASGQATIKLSEQPGKPCPIKLGNTCQVLIDGRPVITGHVHEFSGEHDHDSHTMTVVVRDKTQDAIDSTVGPNIRMKSPITLKQIGERTLRAMGLGGIRVIDRLGVPPFRDGEVVSPSIDDRGFQVLDQWAQKRQALWTTDGRGNLVIDRNRRQRAPGGVALVKRYEDSPFNNVLRASFRNSDLERHNAVSVNGQKSPNDRKHWEGKPKSERTAQADPLQKNWGTANDSEVRPQRRLHARGSKGLSGDSPKKAAKWRSSAARKKGFQYTATVQGVYGGARWLWWPGFLVPVIDEHFEIAGDLLIVDVKFKKSWQQGETTEVSLTLPDAYTTEPSGKKSSARSGRYGTGSVKPGAYPNADGPDKAATESGKDSSRDVIVRVEN